MNAKPNTYRVYIALGSNLGDSVATIEQASRRINALSNTSVGQLSSIYVSKPAFNENQPLFYNAVLEASTKLTPTELLTALQAIELDFGRVRDNSSSLPNSPRTLDLDIIDYEGEVYATPELTLPHPGTLQRDFVVTPLLEIAPNAVLANAKVVNRNHIEFGAIVDVLGKPGVPARAQLLPDTFADAQAAPDHNNTPADCLTGTLSICATPIGNLSDITLRVISALKAASIIYAEDTRVTRKLLAFYDIHTPLHRADEHTLPAVTPQIIEQLQNGQHVAYTSDAGMPGISDPGLPLIRAARAAGCTVEILPGASAVITALAASGFEAHNHFFGGFLPRKAGKIKQALQDVASLQDTVLVFYESVYRTQKTLALIAEVFPEREVCMARELTKLHEEVLRGSTKEIAEKVATRVAAGRTLKGEIVILVGPKRSHPLSSRA